MPIIGIRYQTNIFSDENVILIVNTIRDFLNSDDKELSINIVYRNLSKFTSISEKKIKAFVYLNKDVISADSPLIKGTIGEMKSWNDNCSFEPEEGLLNQELYNIFEETLFSNNSASRPREEYTKCFEGLDIESSEEDDDEILIKSCKRLHIGETDGRSSVPPIVEIEAASAPLTGVLTEPEDIWM